MSIESEQDLRTKIHHALAQIKNPFGIGDVLSAALVQGLSINDGLVSFMVEASTADLPRYEALRREVEVAIGTIAGVKSVTAILTAEKKPTKNSASPSPKAAQRLQLPLIKQIIAVASGKGGVGKSTTAVNLALALKQMGLAVGLLDADIYGPSLPRLLGLTQKPTVNNGQRLQPLEAYGLKVMSMGFLVAEDSPMIWRGPMVQSALVQMLRDVEWGALDVLVVDMPPGTGDAQLTMAQQVPLAGAVIVSTPQDLALLDARRGLAMFKRVDVPVLGIIENMSYFICPSCGAEAHIFGHGGAQAEALRLAVPFLGQVPLDMQVRELSDAGTPVVEAAPHSQPAQAYGAMAQEVWQQLTTVKRVPPTIKILP